MLRTLQLRQCSGPALAEAEAAPPAAPRIPVTVITGFLGAGKTTLLNHLLSQPHGRRLAVIENEYGEVGVDDALVQRREGTEEEVFELNNGCVCCTVRGDLVRILGKLARREQRLDGVIIETTGLANPLPVVQTFITDDDVEATYDLDGIVTVVDARHVTRHLDAAAETEHSKALGTNEALAQLAFADRIVVNKTDLVSEAELAALMERIRTINAAAEVAAVEHGKVGAQLLLEVGGFDPEKAAKVKLEHESVPQQHAHSHAHSHSHGGSSAPVGHQHHHHRDNVSSVGFKCIGELNVAAVDCWLRELSNTPGLELFRYKGVLSVKGSDCKFFFQGVHQMRQGPDPLPGARWAEGEERESRLIFIGTGLDREHMERGFEMCKAPERLRFAVGDAVRCFISRGPQERVARRGTVRATWENGYPYTVQLNPRKGAKKGTGGETIFAPIDDDSVITAV